ncbi:MAG TPA: HAD family phosphatase [Solirubrobacteraceae bacterium]|nr:HAD family phosphatase [Solirubrobacteraceae bacterium]
MSDRIEAVVSDFGGVLTTPLMNFFARFQDDAGIPLDALGKAMARIADEQGFHPLYELEKGKLSEPRFVALLEQATSAELGRQVHLHGLADAYWSDLDTNDAMVAYLRSLRERGYRLALLTNNVREWEPRWRAMVPVDELFELVVDSAFVGTRKPDPGIYELTLDRLGLAAEQCVFIDDIEVNCEAAQRLGMHAVWFRDTEQAIADVDAALGR